MTRWTVPANEESETIVGNLSFDVRTIECATFMSKDKIQYRNALLDGFSHSVSIDNIDKQFADSHSFYCPCCHGKMYATFGEIQAHHFRHQDESESRRNGCSYNGYLHNFAECVFEEEYQKCLEDNVPFYLEVQIPIPCNNACVLHKDQDCSQHYVKKIVDLTIEYRYFSKETKVDTDKGFRRPDILLETEDGRQIWIEIWVTHQTEEDKRKDGRIIEIKINDEDDVEKIREHRLVQSRGNNGDVQLFGFELDGENPLFTIDDIRQKVILPCEKYFYYASGIGGKRSKIIDNPSDVLFDDMAYQLLLRLNWGGRHDAAFEYKGVQFTNDVLEHLCLIRHQYPDGGPNRAEKILDPLVVSEHRNSVIIPASRATIKQPSNNTYVAHRKKEPEVVPMYPQDDEWIDLGLPSGTKWASVDLKDKLDFRTAKRLYGSNLPTKEQFKELLEHCTKEWLKDRNTIVFTSKSGKNIFFPCPKPVKYWLRNYDGYDQQFGQSFSIESGGRVFGPNNCGVNHLLSIRLVMNTLQYCSTTLHQSDSPPPLA